MFKRWSWQIIILAVLLVGTLLMLTGFDAGLPLHESVDERHNLDEVYVLRGITDDPLWKPGYPPGILYVNYGAQVATELLTGKSAWDQACQVILNVRMTGIFFNLFTAAFIALTARKLGGAVAGVLAALGWLVAPRVLEQTQFGFPQTYENFFFVVSLYLAILSVEKRRSRYAVLSVLAGLGAVIFKYVTFPVLALGVGAALWNLRGNPKRWWRVLLVEGGLIVFTAVALVTLGGVGALAGSGHVETNQFLSGGLTELFDPALLMYIFENAAGQLGIPLILFAALLGAGTLAYWPRALTWQRLGWIGAVVLGLSHITLMATYLVHLDGIDRNLLSSSGVLMVAIVVAVVSLARWISRRLRQPALGFGVGGVLMLLWLTPQAIGAWGWVNYRNLPVTYVAMVDWVETNLPEETLLVNDNRPFIRDWNCANYRPREVIWDEDIMDHPIADWLERDVYYAVLTQSRIGEMKASPEGQAYLQQMTQIQQFPPPGEEDQWRSWRRGEEASIAVYQLWPAKPEVSTDILFGDEIRLVGGNIDTDEAVPGGVIRLQFYWQPMRMPDSDYNLFIHLTPVKQPAEILAQQDGPPSHIELRPTSTWDDLDETLISDDFRLDIPATVKPGLYKLRIGLYDWQTGVRLPLESGRDSITVPIFIAPR